MEEHDVGVVPRDFTGRLHEPEAGGVDHLCALGDHAFQEVDYRLLVVVRHAVLAYREVDTGHVLLDGKETLLMRPRPTLVIRGAGVDLSDLAGRSLHCRRHGCQRQPGNRQGSRRAKQRTLHER